MSTPISHGDRWCEYQLKDGFHRCGSRQFNLWQDEIDQEELCDVHYWQARATRSENMLKESYSQLLDAAIGMESINHAINKLLRNIENADEDDSWGCGRV